MHLPKSNGFGMSRLRYVFLFSVAAAVFGFHPAGGVDIPTSLLLRGHGIPKVGTISPDGSKVIIANDHGPRGSEYINVMDVSSGRRYHLTRYKFRHAAWGEDSNTLYAYETNGPLHRVKLDPEEEPLLVRIQGDWSWSPILYPRNYNPYLYVRSTDGGEKVRRCRLNEKTRIWSSCELMARSAENSYGFVFGYSGELIARFTDGPKGRRLFQTLDGKQEWRTLVALSEPAALYALGFVQPDNTVWALSDGGGEYETVALVRLDLSSGEELIYFQNDKFDLKSAAVTRSGVPLFAEYHPDYPVIEFFRNDVEQAFDALFDLVGKPASIKMISHDDEVRFLTVEVTSYKVVSAHFLLDLEQRTARQLSVNRLEKFRDRIPSSRPVTIKASDGRSIFGYLSMPVGRDTPPPMIVQVHGGPWQREYWNASGAERFFLSRGYSFLRLNYRGSKGYNRSYMEAGFGEVFGAMKTDIRDAAAWAVSHGYAEEGKIVLLGRSFGGLLVLLELIDAPGRYAAGIAVHPVSDALGFWKKDWHWPLMTPAWRSLFQSEELPARELARHSPLRNFRRITNPLLLITSPDDRRVPSAGTKKLFGLLSEQGKAPVRHYEYRGMGHDVSRAQPALVVHMYETMDKFLREVAKIKVPR